MRTHASVKVALVRGPLVAPLGSLNNEPTPALGLALLAGSLKEAGFDVYGIDATALDLERITPIENTDLQYNGIGTEEIIQHIHPDTAVIGISCMFSHEWTYHKQMLTSIRKAFPKAILVIGGEHSTALADYLVLDCPAIDYCILGEGEETIVDLCTVLAAGGNLDDVAGLVYVRNGEVVRSAPRQRMKELDQVPWPAWDILPIEIYLNNNVSFGASFGRNMPILASRGCPYQCTFCSNPNMWTTRYIIRSPDSVLAEIKYYKQKYNIQGIQFYDLTAIVKKEWTVEFCTKLIAENLNLEWSLPSGTRSEALDDESLSLLAKAGCRYLVYAPESGSPETLAKIKKKIILDRMKGSIRTAIRNGISVRANLILGFPHERRKNVYETLLLQLQFAWFGVDDCPLYPFQPYPGSELFRYLKDNGTITLKDSYFEELATLSTGKFSLPKKSFCEHIGLYELHMYRLIGFFLFYFLSYALHPYKVVRTIKNLFFTEKSNSVFEQRMKDQLRRLKKTRASA